MQVNIGSSRKFLLLNTTSTLVGTSLIFLYFFYFFILKLWQLYRKPKEMYQMENDLDVHLTGY